MLTLLNELGNCLYVAGDYARAKEIFLEAGTVLAFPYCTSLISLFIYFSLSFYSFRTLQLSLLLAYFIFCH